MAIKIDILNRAAFAAGETQEIQSEEDDGPTVALLVRLFPSKLRELLEKRPWRFARLQTQLVEVTSRVKTYLGDGGTTDYLVPYDNSDPSHLSITVDGAAVEFGSGWTYTPPANGYDAKVTFVVAPAAAAAIAITVTTKRNGWEHVYELPDNFVSPVALLYDGERPQSLIDPRERIPFDIVQNNSGTGFLLCTDEDDFDAFEYVGVPTQMTILSESFVEALVCLLAAQVLKAIPKDMRRAREMMNDFRVAYNDAVAVDNANAGQLEHQESAALASRWE